MCVYTYIYIYIDVYVYIYIERERERCIHMYIRCLAHVRIATRSPGSGGGSSRGSNWRLMGCKGLLLRGAKVPLKGIEFPLGLV